MTKTVALLPRIPTPEMVAAAWECIEASKQATGIAKLGPGLGTREIWQAMFDAAPATRVEQPELVERVANSIQLWWMTQMHKPMHRDVATDLARAAIEATRTQTDQPKLERLEAKWLKWPDGDAGDAIDFACDHCAPDEALAFMNDWRQGLAGEWPGYVRWLKTQRDGALSSSSLSNG